MTKIIFDLEELLALDNPSTGEEMMTGEIFVNWIRGGLGGPVFRRLAEIIEEQIPSPAPEKEAIVWAFDKVWLRIDKTDDWIDSFSQPTKWNEISKAPDFKLFELTGE